jgi:sialidase-1
MIPSVRVTMKRACCLLAFLALCVPLQAADSNEPVETDVFRAGEGSYHTYRIPSVIVTTKGTLLAFCEGRVKDKSDSGNIDLLLRRSTDNGKTWSPPQVVWDDAGNTCGNPCPVVDRDTGTIWLLLTWNAGHLPEKTMKPGFGDDSRLVFVSHSDDDGLAWSKPQNITCDVKREEWSWYATGPGNGIQLEKGSHKGRLVVACDHKIPAEKDALSYSHVVYTDDHGRTWQLGGGPERDKCNECEVAELSDGKLLLNMRSHDRSVRMRQISRSDDSGATWSKATPDETLIEPICQASLRRYRWPTADLPGVLLFSNPADNRIRQRLTVRASTDDGQSWPTSKVLCEGSSAYSCLCVLPDGTIGCLYERDNYGRIVFAKFPLDWVLK